MKLIIGALITLGLLGLFVVLATNVEGDEITNKLEVTVEAQDIGPAEEESENGGFLSGGTSGLSWIIVLFAAVGAFVLVTSYGVVRLRQ